MKRSQTVVMRKIGGFYHTFDEDAYVLFHFFKYKINNGKSGFPISAVDRVQSVLEENKINYIIRVSDDEERKEDFKKLNRYDHFSRIGSREYEEEKKRMDLQNRIKELSKEKLEKLENFLDELVHE